MYLSTSASKCFPFREVAFLSQINLSTKTWHFSVCVSWSALADVFKVLLLGQTHCKNNSGSHLRTKKVGCFFTLFPEIKFPSLSAFRRLCFCAWILCKLCQKTGTGLWCMAGKQDTIGTSWCERVRLSIKTLAPWGQSRSVKGCAVSIL